MAEVLEEENNVVVEGQLMGFNERELKTDAIILSILVADETDGLTCKMRFADPGGKNDLKKNQKECADLKAGLYSCIQLPSHAPSPRHKRHTTVSAASSFHTNRIQVP